MLSKQAACPRDYRRNITSENQSQQRFHTTECIPDKRDNIPILEEYESISQMLHNDITDKISDAKKIDSLIKRLKDTEDKSTRGIIMTILACGETPTGKQRTNRKITISEDINSNVELESYSPKKQKHNFQGDVFDSDKGKYFKSWTEKRVLIKYRISFDFGPLEMDAYSCVLRRLLKLCKDAGVKCDIHNDFSFDLYINKKRDLTEFCMEWFKSVPKVSDSNELTTNEVLTVCCLEKESLEDQAFREELDHVIQEAFPLYFVCSNDDRVTKHLSDKNIPAKNILFLSSQACEIYDKFYEHLIEEIKRILPQSAEHFQSSFESLLHKLENRKIPDSEYLSEECHQIIKRTDSITGHIYNKEERLLTIIVEDTSDTEKIQNELSQIKKAFDGKTIWKSSHDVFSIKHCKIRPGVKLHITAESYGTLGMIGHLKKDGEEKQAAVTGAHVLSSETPAYVIKENEFVEIGTCIWPPPTNLNKSNIEDISLTPFSENALKQLDFQNRIGKIHLYQEKLSTLNYRKVFKFGAETDYKEGYIDDVKVALKKTDAAYVTGEDCMFSKPGDSGSIVLTRIGNNFYALAIIYGGHKTSNEHGKDIKPNSCLIVNLNDAVRKFNDSNSTHGTLELKEF